MLNLLKLGSMSLRMIESEWVGGGICENSLFSNIGLDSLEESLIDICKIEALRITIDLLLVIACWVY